MVLAEAGGNTLSIGTAHCSRRRPAVYGYSTNPALGAVMVPGSGHAGGRSGGSSGHSNVGVANGSSVSSAAVDGGSSGGGAGGEETLHFTQLCKPSTIEDTLQYWG